MWKTNIWLEKLLVLDQKVRYFLKIGQLGFLADDFFFAQNNRPTWVHPLYLLIIECLKSEEAQRNLESFLSNGFSVMWALDGIRNRENPYWEANGWRRISSDQEFEKSLYELSKWPVAANIDDGDYLMFADYINTWQSRKSDTYVYVACEKDLNPHGKRSIFFNN